ncbi:MAG TPA: EAL domain-containing protein, partial [Methyloceanibacter sp.]|nr:EAL domain-containing protein [Methyloceanibacter sp.]
LKVDRRFVTGCAKDRLKQSICRRILDLAGSYGARTVAEGVETWADFLTVREMGFDLVQGFLFAKPVSAQKFVQTCWSSSQPSLPAPRNGARPAGVHSGCRSFGYSALPARCETAGSESEMAGRRFDA